MTRVPVTTPLQTMWASRQMIWKVKSCKLFQKSCDGQVGVVCGLPIWKHQQQSLRACSNNRHSLDIRIPGPTRMTRNQLLDAEVKLDQAHQHRDISKMLKGVVTNMHCLTKFSREAGLTPYL